MEIKFGKPCHISALQIINPFLYSTSRCFPHVTNISTKTGLKHLTKVPADDDPEIDDPILIEEEFPEIISWDVNAEYRDALERDIVSAARKLVNAVRASGQRREALESLIIDGNTHGWFKNPAGEPYQLANLVLLRDVDTRWSSILYMIDRLIINYPVRSNCVSLQPIYFNPCQFQAVKIMLNQPEHSDIEHLALSDLELQVLSDIRRFLNVFHSAQQVVSAEHTPTLSIVIPTYELLITMLNDLKRHLLNLKHAIQASITKLEEYMGKARSTKMYILAMREFSSIPHFQHVLTSIFLVINPQTKLNYSNTNWSNAESNQAKGWVQEAVSGLYIWSI